MQPGDRIGPYEIVAPLGAGGMGEVYRARDPRLDRQVAIKVLPLEVSEDPQRLERFQREAKALAALNHPSIVTIHEVGEADGLPFLVMELVEGETLDRLIPSGGMELDRFLELAVPLADALAAAHDRGIVHRDLKPGNVMVTNEGAVKVLDFGLAKRHWRSTSLEAESGVPTATLDAMTREGTLLGTAPYMSPEQIQAESTDARSDVFALGVVFHEMLTGGRPFRGETAPTLLSSILRDEPPPISGIRPRLPRHLGRIVSLCLEKRPADRFQSARDVRNQLVQLRKELDAAEPEQEGPVARAPTAPSRRSWTLAAAVSALALLTAVLAWRLLENGASLGRPPSETVSIAVLPLENLSGETEQDYFAAGMTEALISSLAKIDALHVISRTSVLRYENSNQPAPEIARELGVRLLLEGTVLRAGDRVRITTQLIEASEDRHLWAESYERELRDILALQDDVARAVAREVEIELSPEEVLELTSRREVDPAAYEQYLYGQHFYSAWQGDLEQALAHFQKAVELDPTYAPAHAGVSKALAVLGYVHALKPLEAWGPASAAADRAIALEEGLAEAWVARGRVQLVFGWEWDAAATSLDRAVELNPSSFEAHDMRSLLYMALGQHDRNVEIMRRALALDPLSVYANARLAWSLIEARHYEEAVEHLRQALEIHPENSSLQQFLSKALALLGRDEEALAACNESERSCHRIFAILGMDREARVALERRNEARSEPRPFIDATVHAQLGNIDLAFATLEEAYAMRSPDLITLGVEPLLDPVRDDPRYRDLMRRLDLAK